MANILMDDRLCWLGLLGLMEPMRMPKQLLFGELEKRRPCHGMKKRWQDVVTLDLQAVGIKDAWYEVAQDREAWYQVCSNGIRSLVEQTRSVCAANLARGSGIYTCPCERTFCRKGDQSKHGIATFAAALQPSYPYHFVQGSALGHHYH